MSSRFVAMIVGVAVVSAWYWASPWPIAIAAALAATLALTIAIHLFHSRAVFWAVGNARPMQMHWSFSVLLTERAFDAIGIPLEDRDDLKARLGGSVKERPYFKGLPTQWMSDEVTVDLRTLGRLDGALDDCEQLVEGFGALR